MKTRPILFNGPMVRAILEGRKTQMRRVCDIIWDTSKYWGNYDCWTFRKNGKPFIGFGTSNNGQEVVAHHCRYGRPGYRLWVRETWRSYDVACAVKGTRPLVRYRADGAWSCGCKPMYKEPGGPWKPSIHMPPWASRIMLEVTGVRVERVQEITEVDAIAEGIEPMRPGPAHVMWRDYLDPSGTGQCSALMSYQSLWDSINAKSGFGWDVNPWVWVVAFKRVQS